ncbi:MAG TPA: TonB family protein [Steroidobacteraceae bacterium]|nr:TonB family protein [Steroidobacteraceae bacterium]
MNTRAPEIVVVDHDLEGLRTLVAPLRKQFEFYLTVSANDAVAALTRFPVRVLVTGQTLFTGSGLELLTEARRRSPGTARVLMLNAVERRAIEAELAAAELFYVLKRPCTAEQLKEVLDAAARAAQVGAGETGEHIVLESDHEPEHVHADAPSTDEPITVLTTDVDLYEAIRTAVHGRHPVHLAAKLEDAANLAASGQCAVLVTDVALTESALRRITGHLRAREDALVTIAVGNREQGNALMGLLATGAIHRFLLKPVTPGLARLAVESATRQHASARAHRHAETHFELRPASAATAGSAAEIAAAAQAHLSEHRAVPERRAPRNIGRIAAIAGAALVVLAAIGGGWWYYTHRPPEPDRRALAIASTLAAAQAAARTGHVLEPAPGSAFELYTEVLRLDPQNAAARTGIDQIADNFISQAETALVQEDLDAATLALAHARQVRPEHRRLKFLDAQLAKDRQELLVLQARQSATAGNLQQAKELLQQAQQVETPKSTEVNSAQQAIDSRAREQQVAQWLDLARQRVAQNRFTSPPDDSAKFYLRSAQRVDPQNVAVQQGLRDLGDRVVASADTAIKAQRFDVARNWIAQAQDLDVGQAKLDELNQRVNAGVDVKARSDLLALVVKRTDENRLLEPAQDSARYYLDRLTQLDPAFPGTDRAAQALGAKLVARAQGATASRQYDNATRLLIEARAIGYTGADLATSEAALRAAQAPSVPEQPPPTRVKYAAPTYPQDALAKGLEGWVDVSFAVNAAGEVIDARVDDAQPRRQFDRAALAAVGKWKYQPSPSGSDYAQRLKTRVQFKLAD